MSATIYVSAKISPDGNFADCIYSRNVDGSDPYDSGVISIPEDSGSCIFSQAESTDLLLIGATFKTIGSAPGMNASNFAPADDENNVAFAMPLTSVITKGVVLLFSTPGVVESLYPSSDPQVTNDGVSC